MIINLLGPLLVVVITVCSVASLVYQNPWLASVSHGLACMLGFLAGVVEGPKLMAKWKARSASQIAPQNPPNQ